jgi:hypothetical protein
VEAAGDIRQTSGSTTDREEWIIAVKSRNLPWIRSTNLQRVPKRHPQLDGLSRLFAGLLRFDFVEYCLGGNVLLDLFQLWIVGRKVQPLGKRCHQPGERGQLMFS